MIPYLEIPSLHLFGPLEVHVFGRLLTLGPVDIHAFGVLVAIGILVGAGRTRYRARQLGLSDVETASMITWVVVIGFVVAHLFAVVAYQPDRLRELDFGGKVSLLLDPRRGLSSFGGFLGALIALLVFSRNNRYPLFPAADSLLFGLIYGWLFGRLGCYSAHDHPGRFTDFFLAVPYPEGTRHDLGFDEALFAGVLVIAFTLLARRFRPPGFYATITCLIYGPLRFGLDFLRAKDVPGADPRYLGLTPAQYGALGVFIAGIVFAVLTVQKHRAAVAAYAADQAKSTK